MEFKPGMLVSPTTRCVDLCFEIDMYRLATILEQDEVGIVVKTRTRNVFGITEHYARILSPSGISGWCLEKFLRPR